MMRNLQTRITAGARGAEIALVAPLMPRLMKPFTLNPLLSENAR